MATNSKKKTKSNKATEKMKATMPSEQCDMMAKGCCSINTKTLLIILVVLTVIQLIFSIILYSQGNDTDINMKKDMMDKGMNLDDSLMKKIDSIEGKVNRIDNFFASNVQNYGSGSGNEQQAAPTPSAVPSQPVGEPDIQGEPTLGDANAPVTIVEYSDYECPFCARFYSQTLGQLKREYIDTGKVKFVYKDFPLDFHQNAKPAAIAANCVFKELGDMKYFEYHDIIFENQQSLNAQNLKKWALEVGASQSAYDTCIKDPQMAAEVDEDMREGSSFGVSGTPSFLINGELIVGAVPYSQIKQAIDSKLS